MSTNNGYQNFYVEGFAMVVSPGHVADAVIYFRAAGGVINIKGADLFSKEKVHLGWVHPTNISLEVGRAIREYAKKHKSKWVRVHNQFDSQK